MEKKNNYEMIQILKGTFTEEEYKKAFNSIKDYLSKYEIKEIEELGKKRLAYEVRKNKEGYYIIFIIRANKDDILEIERYCRINEDILKFIVVRK